MPLDAVRAYIIYEDCLLVRGGVNRIPFQRVYLLFDEGFLNLFPLTLIDCPTVPSFAVAQAPFA